MNITRKQIAQRLGTSAYSIRRNEVRLGLAAIRVRVNGRVILYPEKKAVEVLRQRGLEL